LQNDQTDFIAPTTNAITKRECASVEVLANQLTADPSRVLRMNQIEEFTQKARLTGRLVNRKIQIAVIVNVLYRTAAENISDAQIHVLN
jgi:hypothetical protein